MRTNIIHQNIDTAPVILNLICLLAVDEIEPGAYDNSRNDVIRTLEFRRSTTTPSYRASWEVFPPDLPGYVIQHVGVRTVK